MDEDALMPVIGLAIVAVILIVGLLFYWLFSMLIVYAVAEFTAVSFSWVLVAGVWAFFILLNAAASE